MEGIWTDLKKDPTYTIGGTIPVAQGRPPIPAAAAIWP